MKVPLLIVTLLCLTLTAQAQLCKTVDCNKLKDYCNARITKAYIESYLEQHKTDLGKYEKIRKQIFIEEPTIRNHPDYDTLSAALAVNFKKTKEKLTDKINSVTISTLDESSAEHSGEIFINQIDAAILPEIKTQIKEYEALKQELRNELAAYFKRAIDSEPVKEQTQQPKATPPPPAQDHADHNNRIDSPWISFRGFNLWIAALLSLNAILFGFTVYIYRRTRRRRSHATPDDPNPGRLGNDWNDWELGAIRATVEANTRNLDELQQKLNEVASRLNESPVERYRVEDRPVTPAPTVENNTTFYMAFPIGNYFSNKGRSDSKPDTFYTFLVNPDNRNEANFHIHAGEAMVKEYMTMSEECVKPACQEQNVAPPSVKRIITERPGTAILEDDKWIIKTKAVIRYE